MGDIKERIEIPDSMFELPDNEAENKEVIQATEHLIECARDILIEKGKHLLIVIDALDQFDDEDRALNLSWLRKVRGVRLVCSIQDTLNDSEVITGRLSSSKDGQKRVGSFHSSFAKKQRVKDCWTNKGRRWTT